MDPNRMLHLGPIRVDSWFTSLPWPSPAKPLPRLEDRAGIGHLYRHFAPARLLSQGRPAARDRDPDRIVCARAVAGVRGAKDAAVGVPLPADQSLALRVNGWRRPDQPRHRSRPRAAAPRAAVERLG